MSKPSVTPSELRDRAAALIPVLRERAAATENLRRLPDETVRDLVKMGFIRATLPSRLGGAEIDYRTMMELVATLAHGCASTAWVACNFLSCTFLLALWPREAQDEVWNESLDAILTGTLIFPAGRAKRVDGGYRLSGRWPFGSGIDHADRVGTRAWDPEPDIFDGTENAGNRAARSAWGMAATTRSVPGHNAGPCSLPRPSRFGNPQVIAPSGRGDVTRSAAWAVFFADRP